MKRTLAIVAATALLATGCSSGGSGEGSADPTTGATGAAGATDGSDAGGADDSDADDSDAADGTTAEQLEIATAFYPLQFAVESIGGEHVTVTSLTPPGAEPHDVELRPRDVGRMSEADLIVYLHGFQPAVDDAVATVGSTNSFDVEEHAELSLEVEEEGHSHDDGHDHGPTDPHFWLDPTRYASVADAIADRLSEISPEHADEFTRAAEQFTSELDALDAEFQDGLATCEHRDLVTGHAAFGYLADRYDLHQVGITGLTPESEPTAAQIRDLVSHVRESGVSTIYAEPLVSPALTETVARESGVNVALLDPLEGITDESAGADYFEVMRANLQTLIEGQQCEAS